VKPDQIPLDGLGVPGSDQHSFEVIFTTASGATQSWSMKGEDLSGLRAALAAAGFDVADAHERRQSDLTRDNQRASMGRLLEHISFHHDELRQITAEQCTWIQNEWRKAGNVTRLRETGLLKEYPDVR
jgi:hypothetical protein